MKIRSGFVSNSSSSSFIVRFPKDPTDINNLREMMGDCAPDCGYNWMDPVSSEEVIEAIHRMAQQPTDFESYYNDKKYDYDYTDDLVRRFDSNAMIRKAYEDRWWSELSGPEQELVYRSWLYQEYQSIHGEKDVYVRFFELSDECGDFQSQLEHGNIFRNVEHTYTSNH